MRLDKIKFARVVQFIDRQLDSAELTELDSIIDINVEPVSTGFVETEKVDELLRCVQERLKGGLIPAIRAYRALTNVGLKEAKEAVEKHCVILPMTVDPKDAILGGFTKQAGKS